jgi:hypothetical protein
MASPTLTTGDTTPAIRGCAIEGDGPGKAMKLGEADLLTFVAVVAEHPDKIEGEAEAIEPPEDVGDLESPLGFNWKYDLAADDAATPGDYVPWLKVTWDATSTPPLVEWLKAGDIITIQAAPE